MLHGACSGLILPVCNTISHIILLTMSISQNNERVALTGVPPFCEGLLSALLVLRFTFAIAGTSERRVAPQLIFLVDGFKAVACLGEGRNRTSTVSAYLYNRTCYQDYWSAFPITYLTITPLCSPVISTERKYLLFCRVFLLQELSDSCNMK